MSLMNVNRIERRARRAITITAMVAFAGSALAAQAPTTQASGGTQKGLDITLGTKPSPLKLAMPSSRSSSRIPRGSRSPTPT